jgi:hypothetical protein
MMKGLDSFVSDYFWVDYFIFDSPSHTCRRIHLSPERVNPFNPLFCSGLCWVDTTHSVNLIVSCLSLGFPFV